MGIVSVRYRIILKMANSPKANPICTFTLSIKKIIKKMVMLNIIKVK